MENKKKYHGVVVPLMTPLLKPDILDRDAFCQMIEHVIKRGVHGIFPMSSSGEAVHNARQVWRDANRLALEAVQKTVPVYSGAIAPSTTTVIENIKYLESIGAKTAVATVPFYTTVILQSEIMRHFETILEHTEIDICIYNIPSLTGGNDILPETIKKLAGHERVVAYKDSCPNWDHHQRTIMALETENISVLSGGEELCCASIVFGAQGNISGLAASFPRLFLEAYEAAAKKRMQKVLEYQKKILQLKNCIRVGPTDCSCMKYILSVIGFGSEQNCYHTQPLNEAQKVLVRNLAEPFMEYV